MACEGDLRGPGRAARSSSLRVADTRSSGAQLCAHLRSGLQLRSDTAAHRRRGIIDVVISLRRSNRPHRLNVALAAYGQVALDDLYQCWRVFTDLGPISPGEYILEYIRERLNRCADWLETASGGYDNQSARGFQFSEYIREYIHLVKPGPGRRNHADCYSPADEAGYSWSGSG